MDDVGGYLRGHPCVAVMQVQLLKTKLGPLLYLRFFNCRADIEHNQDDLAEAEVVVSGSQGSNHAAGGVDHPKTDGVEMLVFRLNGTEYFVAEWRCLFRHVALVELIIAEFGHQLGFAWLGRPNQNNVSFFNSFPFVIYRAQLIGALRVE